MTYVGHLRTARDLTHRAMDSAVRADNKESAAIWQGHAAIREAAFGNTTEARQAASQSLTLAPLSQAAQVEAAVASAIAGDTARAKSLAQDLANRLPLDTQMQSLWLPTIRAQLMLANPSGAIDLLKAAAPVELGQIQFNLNISCLYPVYVRGQAYLATRNGAAATTEFQKLLDQRHCLELLDRVASPPGPGSRLRPPSRDRQSPHRLSGLPHPLERRRPRHPRPEAGQGRVREVAVANSAQGVAITNRQACATTASVSPMIVRFKVSDDLQTGV